MVNEIVEAHLLEVTLIRTEDGMWSGTADEKSYPGGSGGTLSIEPCSDASLLSQVLADWIAQWCSTRLGTTTGG